jgi:hypothetical protein
MSTNTWSFNRHIWLRYSNMPPWRLCLLYSWSILPANTTPTPPPNARSQTHANTSNLIFIVWVHTLLHEYQVLWLFCVIARCLDICQGKNWVHTPQTSQPTPHPLTFPIALRDRQRCARLSVSTCCRCGDLMGADTPTRILPSCSETNLMWAPYTTDSSFKIPSHASGNSEVILRPSFLRRTTLVFRIKQLHLTGFWISFIHEMIQEENLNFWKVTVSVVVRKEDHSNVYLILSGYRDRTVWISRNLC